MKKLLIEQLRKNASVKGKEKTMISTLSDSQLLAVYTKLKNGESAKAIARHVREVWKINTVATPHSISQGVLKFKRRIAHLLITSPGIGTPPSFDESLTGRSNRTPADELEELAELQGDRIKRIIKEERETGIKYPYLNREYQGLAALRKALIKERDYEKKHWAEIQARKQKELKKGFKKKFDKVLTNLDDDGERLISAANRFLEMATKEAILMEEDPD